MASESHVVLEELPFQVADSVDWWYDEAHRCVIDLVPHADDDDRVALRLRALPGAKPVPTTHVGSYACGTTFLGAKLSMSKQFLALQRSDVEVEIAVLREPHYRFNVLCKRSARVLGFVWAAQITYLKTATEYLVLVTTGGLEQFKLTPAKCRFQRLVAHPTRAFWYDPDAHLVVLQTGAKGQELRAFVLEGAIVTKCSKLVVPRVAGVCVATLYGKPYIMLGASGQLLLYHVEPGHDTTCVRALELPFAADAFSVVDDVVIVHSRALAVSCVFDVGLDLAEPLLPPLPLATAGRFLWPAYVAPPVGLWAAVALALPSITRCAGPRADTLLRFLLRRHDATAAKAGVFECLRARVAAHAPVAEVLGHFHLLHRIYSLALRERSATAAAPPSGTASAAGDLVDLRDATLRMLVVLQRECVTHLWLPLLDGHPAPLVGPYLSAYIHSLQTFAIPIDPCIVQVYVQVMVRQGQAHETLPFFATQPDSALVARELETQAAAYRPYFQAALDMYHRLGRVDDVLRLLLDDGNVTMAFRLAQRVLRKHGQLPPQCTPAWFFRSVVAAASNDGPARCWQLFSALHLFLATHDAAVIAPPQPSALAREIKESFPTDRFASPALGAAMARRFGFATTTALDAREDE
ncbi:hypothetical protein ACHHYP_17073 [Achlya hypogyna]|uniref:Uncharacterized protein n=1 Tax=Achlya hypogyna TaxID=1202772 RepID=A0A1V9Y5C5_ACHHY|nr:hypothetical protein ACHHYP_17073 [Achlya hypogyna]